MPNGKSVEMRLPSLDDLFSSQEERDDAKLKRIYEIPLLDIDPFPDHPFKVQDDEDMMNLAESIKANGVLTPATVRKKEDGRYELLSGHRRIRACQIAGLLSFLGKEDDNLLTVDVLCHGITSKKVVEAYIKSKEKQYGKKVKAVSFRIKPPFSNWLNGGVLG